MPITDERRRTGVRAIQRLTMSPFRASAATANMKHAPGYAYTLTEGKSRHAFVSGLQGRLSMTELRISERFPSIRKKLNVRTKFTGFATAGHCLAQSL